MKGIYVDILRGKYESTNGGASTGKDEAFFPCEGGNCEPKEGDLILKLVRRNLTEGEYLHVEPMERPKGMNGPMAGGNFAYSSDSRFRRVCMYPVSIHDRFEGR